LKRKFVREALWALGVLVVGGAFYVILFASDIPYRTGAETPKTSAPPAPGVAAPPAMATVLGLRPGRDEKSLVIQLSLPGKDPDCARNPRIDRFEEVNDTIYANTVFDAPPSGKDCRETTTGELLLTTPGPIADRTVILNSDTTAVWNKLDGGWGHCDRYLGCHPSPDHCAPGRIARLEPSVEIEGQSHVRACDPDWLILDLGRPAGDRDVRVFYRWKDGGWESFANAAEGGCAEILGVEPKFPSALCEKLAPPT
jgi:hypothetical protein